MPKYATKLVYMRLIGDNPRWVWANGVWNRFSVPKHKFIFWLGMQERLKIGDILTKVGIIPHGTCLLCGDTDESHAHLFFNCAYSKQVYKQIAE